MQQNPKKFNDKPMKLICNMCNVFSTIKVRCNHCIKEYCFKCWNTFKVNDFGYRPYKNGCYTSNRCGDCVQEWKPGFAKDEEYESDYIPQIIQNENGTWTDELGGQTGEIKKETQDEKDKKEQEEYTHVDFESEKLTGTKGYWLRIDDMNETLKDTLTNYKGCFYKSIILGTIYMFNNSEDHHNVRKEWLQINKKDDNDDVITYKKSKVVDNDDDDFDELL